MKKKIIHIIDSLGNGGCENMLLRTLPLLTEYNHHILTLSKPGILAPHFQALGIPVTAADRVLTLNRSIKNLNPDLIITYLFHADFYSRLLVRPFSTVKILPFLRTTYNFPRYFPVRIFELLSSFLVHHYFATSSAVKDYYRNVLHVSKDKISVIPNGIDLRTYKPSQKLRLQYRRILNLKADDIVFIDVANFHPNKGHKHLIAAFSDLAKTEPRAKLLLVGEGSLRDEIASRVSALDCARSVLFLGNRRDVPALLNCADIFVSPTYFEGMSNALMESMAAGLPVITTDIPENRLLIKDSVNGVLLPLNSELDLSLTGAMRRLMVNKKSCRELGRSAKGSIEKTYSLPAIAKLWSKELSAYV